MSTSAVAYQTRTEAIPPLSSEDDVRRAVSLALKAVELLGEETSAVIPVPNTSPQQYLCIGTSDEIIEGLLIESWQRFSAKAGPAAEPAAAPAAEPSAS